MAGANPPSSDRNLLLLGAEKANLEELKSFMSDNSVSNGEEPERKNPCSPSDIEISYFDIQRRKVDHTPTERDVCRTPENERFRSLLSQLNITFYQRSILQIHDQDRELLIAVDHLQTVIKEQLRERGYKGELKKIGSTIDQTKTQLLDEVDTIFVLDRTDNYTIIPTSKEKPHIYQVSEYGNVVEPREKRAKFAQHITQIIDALPLSQGLEHHGYSSPVFSGVRFNGPATTVLMTWNTREGKREISMDITLVLQLPVKDDACFQRRLKTRCQQLHEEMPHEIIGLDGTHIFPNPISNRWELTTAQFEAVLLSRIPMETPFKMCIKLSKSIASGMAATILTDFQANPSKEVSTLNEVLINPECHRTRDYMKYGHAFLTPCMSTRFREMSKKAISINTAAIKHITFRAAEKFPRCFMVRHESEEERQKLIINLMAEVFWYLSSDERDVQHFFLDSRISLVSVSTWAAQAYDVRVLLDEVKDQCLHVAHLLSHGRYELNKAADDICIALAIYAVPAALLTYAETTYKIPTHFDGNNCNETFETFLKLAYSMGNSEGGIVQFHDDSAALKNTHTWEIALESFCRYHGILNYITIIEHKYQDIPNTVYMHVSPFPELRSLPSYEYIGGTTPGVDHASGNLEVIRIAGHYFKRRHELYSINETGGVTCSVIHNKNDNSETEAEDYSKAEPMAVSTVTNNDMLRQDNEGGTTDPSKYLKDVPTQSSGRASKISKNERSDSTTTKALLKGHDRLNWTRNKKDWEENIKISSRDIDVNVRELLDSEDSFLKVTNPMTFVPSKETLRSVYHHYEEFVMSLERIKATMSGPEADSQKCLKALAITAKDWSHNLEHNEELTKPQHQLVDVLAFNEQCDVHIWCFLIRPSDNRQQDWEYVMKLGCLTKRRLTGISQSMNRKKADVNIKCHLHYLANVEGRSSLVLTPASHNIRNILYNMAISFLEKESSYKDRLGNDISIYLTARQLSTVQRSLCIPFNLIEGPPGSGKTYIAFHLCSKFRPSEVVYICSTTTYEAYLDFQKNCTPKLIQTERDFKKFIERTNFRNFKCVIVDDAHQLSCSYATWKLFLVETMKQSCQVYIFADSRFQNFKSTDLRALRKCMIDLSDDKEAHFHQLHDVHRNSRKVTSFIASCVEHQNPDAKQKLSCSSPIKGDDVEVRYIKSLYDDSKSNKLLQLISSLLEQGSDADNLPLYEAQDIAVLVDTRNPKKHAALLKDLFRRHIPTITVHSAGQFPVCGLSVDTLDNFMGFDRQVCVCVTTHKSPRFIPHIFAPKRVIRNAQYRAFVSSRGVSRVIFVTDSKIDVAMAGSMKMDRLPVDPRRLWASEATTMIPSSCWLPMGDTCSLMYVAVTKTWRHSGREVRMVTLGGEQLPLGIDTSQILPRHVTSSRDGRTVVVADERSWTVYSRQTPQVYVRQQTHRLDRTPWGVSCTPDGGVMLLVYKSPKAPPQSDYSLRRYSAADGRLVWERSVVRFSPCLTTDLSGRLYLSEWDSVHIYSPGGDQLTSFYKPRDLDVIHAVCPDSTGRWLFTGHRDGTVSLLCDRKISGRQLIRTQDGEGVRSLSLYNDAYLGIGTEDGLEVYNVEGVFI